MKLNNKGQVLAVFIILIPILLTLFALVIDIGLMGIEKRNISNEIKYTIKYGLKNITNEQLESNMNTLLIRNIKNISKDNINITINNNYIKINIKSNYKRLFKLFDTNENNLNITYSGTVSNNKIKIVKE